MPRGRPPGPRGSLEDASPCGGSMTPSTTDVPIRDQALSDVDPEIAAVLEARRTGQAATRGWSPGGTSVPRPWLRAQGRWLRIRKPGAYPGRGLAGGGG